MNTNKIFVLGCGAIGFPLVAFLAEAGKNVVGVRTTQAVTGSRTESIKIETGTRSTTHAVKTIALQDLKDKKGIFVVTTKALANESISKSMQEQSLKGPVVIIQNGLNVEEPFLTPYFDNVLRVALFFTSYKTAPLAFKVRAVNPSPLGVISGPRALLPIILDQLDNVHMPFVGTADIHRFIWKKSIINVVFNSICTLVESDNGVFARSGRAINLARQVVAECLIVARARGVEISENELMEQINSISVASDGILISTLQDIRAERDTEMAFFNNEFVRIADELQLNSELLLTDALGTLVQLKSKGTILPGGPKHEAD